MKQTTIRHERCRGAADIITIFQTGNDNSFAGIEFIQHEKGISKINIHAVTFRELMDKVNQIDKEKREQNEAP